MPTKIELTGILPLESRGARIDQTLAQLYPEYSRVCWQKWIAQGNALINNQRVRGKDKVQGGEALVLNATLSEQTTWTGEAMALTPLYSDNDIFIINKPRGLVVHPGAGNPQHTLVNALLFHDPGLAEIPRAGLIHRLDKDTTGLLVVARNMPAYQTLLRQMQDRQIKREYTAIVKGEMISGGTVNEPIARHPRQRTLRAVVASGKPAVTHYRIRERLDRYTVLEVTLETGRTHQIRVHLAHIQHPILGDLSYGGKAIIPRGADQQTTALLMRWHYQALHAHRLSLTHPVTGEWLSFEAPLPEDFVEILNCLR